MELGAKCKQCDEKINPDDGFYVRSNGDICCVACHDKEFSIRYTMETIMRNEFAKKRVPPYIFLQKQVLDNIDKDSVARFCERYREHERVKESEKTIAGKWYTLRNSINMCATDEHVGKADNSPAAHTIANAHNAEIENLEAKIKNNNERYITINGKQADALRGANKRIAELEAENAELESLHGDSFQEHYEKGKAAFFEMQETIDELRKENTRLKEPGAGEWYTDGSDIMVAGDYLGTTAAQDSAHDIVTAHNVALRVARAQGEGEWEYAIVGTGGLCLGDESSHLWGLREKGWEVLTYKAQDVSTAVGVVTSVCDIKILRRRKQPKPVEWEWIFPTKIMVGDYEEQGYAVTGERPPAGDSVWMRKPKEIE